MLAEQEGCCAICGTEDPGKNGRFNVDHNHDTGEIRGLLCYGCNVGIGHLRDNPSICLAAAEYLFTNGHYG